MMAKVILTVKFFFIWLYQLMLAWLPSALLQMGVGTGENTFVFSFLVVMVFIPELAAMFMVRFQNWIAKSVEVSNGDWKDFISLYSGLWFTRIFIYFSWQISNGVDIPMSIYLAPIGGAGLGGLFPIVRAKMTKKR